MSKQNSVMCKWKANEKCVTVLHPLQCISIPHRGHPQDTRKPKQKRNRQPRSAIPFCGLVTVATGRRCQLDRKWHALTSIIQNLSVFPLPHSAIFSRAGNTWATPCPWGCSRTLPPAWHGGTTKASRVGTLAALLTPQTLPHLDLWAPTAPCTCYGSTTTLWQQRVALAQRPEIKQNLFRASPLPVSECVTLPKEWLPLRLHTGNGTY